MDTDNMAAIIISYDTSIKTGGEEKDVMIHTGGCTIAYRWT